MSRFGMVGPAYTSQSVNADCQACINFYPEINESGAGNAPIYLYPTPGLKAVYNSIEFGNVVRGLFTITGRTFAVVDGYFLEFHSDLTQTQWGVVANDGLPVSMAASPQQLLLASGGTAYIFDLIANTFTAISGATFSGQVAQVGICDDFFLASIKNSKEFYVSAPLDAADWTTNGSAIVSVFPDNIVSMTVVHREIFFTSDTKAVWYYDSGNIFPFDVVAGSDMDQGCAAQNSTVLLNNTVFWLGADERGQGVVWTANGYTPQRISTHAIEFAIQGYGRIDDCVGFTMQDQGHYFYFLYFPTPSVTWVYDAITRLWHQRAYNVATTGLFQAARYQNHTFNFGKHLVGDWGSPLTYELHIPRSNGTGGWDFVTDNGNYIRRVRRAPHISKEQKWLYFHQLQVYLESGLGPSPPWLGPQPPGILILRDSALNLWSIGVSDIGILTTLPIAVAIEQTLTLNDPGNTTSWKVGISTLGVITTTSVVFNPLNPTVRNMVSNSGLFLYQLQVTKTGVLQTFFGGTYQPPGDPLVSLRWSDDAGHRWSNDYTRGVGQAGKFKKRVYWMRLGRARDRVFELSCSDPIPFRIVDAYLDFTGGA